MHALMRFSADTRQPIGDACGPSAAYANQYTSGEALKLRQKPHSQTRSQSGPPYGGNAPSYTAVPRIKPTSPSHANANRTSTQHTRLRNEEKVGIGVILGLNDRGEVVVEDLAAGWPASLSSLLARGDVLLTGAT